MTSPADPARPVFLYDGDCAFCTACARAIERRVPTRASILPWQRADLDTIGVSRSAAEEAVQWVAAPGPPAAGPVGFARLLVDAGGWWAVLGRVLGWAPVLAVAWPVYRLIARNRHRLPGGTAACSLPASERRPPGT